MGAMYYYRTEFELKEGVEFLNVVKAYAEDEDLTADDLDAHHPLFDSWEDPHGPSFEFDTSSRTLAILMDTASTVGFGDEFEEFLERCANEFSAAGAILVEEGNDREPITYGSDQTATTKLRADALRNQIETLRADLQSHVAGTELPMDEATEMVRTMKGLIEEAITSHIYDEGDEVDPGCGYHQAVADAAKFLGEAS